MTQTVSAWALTAQSRVTFRVNPTGVCGGGTGTGFCKRSLVFFC
jgi:hypothetical protein